MVVSAAGTERKRLKAVAMSRALDKDMLAARKGKMSTIVLTEDAARPWEVERILLRGDVGGLPQDVVRMIAWCPSVAWCLSPTGMAVALAVSRSLHHHFRIIDGIKRGVSSARYRVPELNLRLVDTLPPICCSAPYMRLGHLTPLDQRVWDPNPVGFIADTNYVFWGRNMARGMRTTNTHDCALSAECPAYKNKSKVPTAYYCAYCTTAVCSACADRLGERCICTTSVLNEGESRTFYIMEGNYREWARGIARTKMVVADAGAA